MAQDLKTLIVLFKAYQSMIHQVKLSLINTDLTVKEFTALEVLYSKKELTTSELRDYVLVPNSSMTYVLDTLEKKELIKREKAVDDKRIQLLSLTNKGNDLFKESYEVHFKHMRKFFNELDSHEEKALQNYLKRIGKIAQNDFQNKT